MVVTDPSQFPVGVYDVNGSMKGENQQKVDRAYTGCWERTSYKFPGMPSVPCQTLNDFEGQTFSGNDNNFNYFYTVVSGNTFKQSGSYEFLVGTFDSIDSTGTIAYYNDGDYCRGHNLGNREGTVVLVQDENLSVGDINVSFEETSTCRYKATIVVQNVCQWLS